MTTMTKPTDWPGIGTGFVEIGIDWKGQTKICYDKPRWLDIGHEWLR